MTTGGHTAAHPHCGALVVAAVRALLDGDQDVAAELLAGEEHITREAVHVAANLAACLNRVDPGHGDRDMQIYALHVARSEEET